MIINTQKSDVVAAQRMVWGDAEELCANDCGRDAAPYSCYCEPCEEELEMEGSQ